MNQELEQTISVYLPEEGNGPYVEGALNGVSFRIRTGTVVEVPERIAAILAASRTGLSVDAEAVGAFVEAGGKRLM